MKKVFKYTVCFIILMLILAYLTMNNNEEQQTVTLIYKDGIILGSLTIMAAYFLVYFLVSREDGGRSICYTLMCFILIVQTTLYGDCIFVRVFPNTPPRFLVWYAYLTVIWLPVILYYLSRTLTRSKSNMQIKSIYLYSIALTLLSAVFPISAYRNLIIVLDFSALVITLASIGIICTACVRKIEGAGIILTGTGVIYFTEVYDFLCQANLIQTSYGVITPAGGSFFMFLLSFPMSDQYVKAYRKVRILSDELTEKLIRERELMEKVHSLDQLKDEFLTNISLELQTPLNGIVNITQSLINGIGGHLNWIQTQNIEIISNSARKVLLMIDDLPDVSNLHHGGMKLKLSPVDLKEIIDNQVFLLQRLYKKKELNLINDFPAESPPVFGDEEKIRQITGNLIRTSLKYTSAGSVRIVGCIGGRKMYIRIENSGIVIDKDKLKNVFHMFELKNGVFQKKYDCSSIGIYLAKQLIELHGGAIWITSDEQSGTTTHFTLPLYHAGCMFKQDLPKEQLKQNMILNEKAGLEADLKFYHILAVDDSPADLHALKSILQMEGYKVKGVANGKEALRILEKGVSVDLVILDIMMPEASGYKVLELLRQKYNMVELPILILTARKQKECVSLCFQMGGNDFLQKPFESDELFARVKCLIKLKNAVNQSIASEMSFLQAQIKPHFIHNALGTIASLCSKDPEIAKNLILDLSDYLRSCFDSSDNQGLTTLLNEIELVQAYLSIEQARFQSRLKVYFHLQDNVDCPIPLLTIQPLVENAVHHGLLKREEGGEIHISLKCEETRIRIEVKDNGVGIEENKIKGFFETGSEMKGVGLSNINRRLKAFYGEGLAIESTLNQGTLVYFYIPYHFEGENSEDEIVDSGR